jgi:hypothetical protein
MFQNFYPENITFQKHKLLAKSLSPIFQTWNLLRFLKIPKNQIIFGNLNIIEKILFQTLTFSITNSIEFILNSGFNILSSLKKYYIIDIWMRTIFSTFTAWVFDPFNQTQLDLFDFGFFPIFTHTTVINFFNFDFNFYFIWFYRIELGLIIFSFKILFLFLLPVTFFQWFVPVYSWCIWVPLSLSLRCSFMSCHRPNSLFSTSSSLLSCSLMSCQSPNSLFITSSLFSLALMIKPKK